MKRWKSIVVQAFYLHPVILIVIISFCCLHLRMYYFSPCRCSDWLNWD